ncbi:3-oxoadipate enol-lactonase [Luteimonas panaciterrae]|uniref:3-oxoadipate enol-lactonase n=1 Tax=Luteimonas panaciterrae TaxID=363885 RepID=UPI001CFB9FE6|nr:3-oxoadipate enol-lactonase [Luteimonas panaciterrae]
MPFLALTQYGLHYRVDGLADRPWLTLCNSIGTDLHMWDDQIDVLGQHFRILRYDCRGHARSIAPPPPWTIANLGHDVLALFDVLGIERTHFCGLSLGGLVGQWLALQAPQRIGRMIVCSTAAKIGSTEAWRARIAQLREHGLDGIAAATPSRWFTDAFTETHPARIQALVAPLRAMPPEIYAAFCEVLIATDFRHDLSEIAAPLLAIAGSDDTTTPPVDLRFIAEHVKNGRYLELPGRHLTNVESAPAFTRAVHDFLHS